MQRSWAWSIRVAALKRLQLSRFSNSSVGVGASVIKRGSGHLPESSALGTDKKLGGGLTEARQAVQQMSALSAVLPLLLSREEVTGLPLKRAFCALHTWDRNCSVVVRPLHTEFTVSAS